MSANSTTPGLELETSAAQLTIIRTFTILTSILGTIGNTLTIVAIVREKLYQNASFLFILNLSICNLIHCVIFHPLLAVQSFHGIWTHYESGCIAFGYGLFCNLGTELWGYTCITINRYICVVHHQRYCEIYGKSKIIIGKLVFSWTFYPLVFLLPLTNAWGHFEYSPQKIVCYPFAGYDCTGFCLFVYIIALTSTVPVILYCYSAIIHKYVKTQKKVGLSRERSTFRSTQIQTQQPTIKTDSEKKRLMSELRMAFTILAVISVFTCCRLPFMILYLYDPSTAKVDSLLHTILIYVGSSSNWINPIIYSFSNKTIYNSLKKLFATCKKTFVVQN